jgi:hypothetical protein
MPRRIQWRDVAVEVDATAAEAVVSKLKAFDIDKSNAMGCTMCLSAEHKMRYRQLVCSAATCVTASPIKCAWRGKLHTCLSTEKVSVFEYGKHNSAAPSPAPKKLSLAHKAFCRDLAESHLRPMRIRHALARKFATPWRSYQA